MLNNSPSLVSHKDIAREFHVDINVVKYLARLKKIVAKEKIGGVCIFDYKATLDAISAHKNSKI